MTADRTTNRPALRQSVVLRVALYYAAVLGAMYAAWRFLPSAQMVTLQSLDALFGGAARESAAGADRESMVVAVVLAMVGAVLLSLPVAWVYVLTRAKRGYQQSVVQTLVVLPIVVAGVVVLVKHSLALAFSLAGILAAVRFRNTLDDSKDAVYVFLATGIGLAAAVDLRVATAISLIFNAVILVLWVTDFGRTPAKLEGRLAERRLRRAMEHPSRTGTFVARIDDEVFRDMSPEQLQKLADRARRRARRNEPESPDTDDRREAVVRVRTYDVEQSRRAVEPLLNAHLKRWRYGGVVREPDGADVLEYEVVLKKNRSLDELLDRLRAGGAPHVVGAELG